VGAGHLTSIVIINPFFVAVFALCGLLASASGQLTFTSGVDPNAAPNGGYAAVEFWNFSNTGGSGDISSGTVNNLFGISPQGWAQQVYNVTFSYAPTKGVDGLSVNNSGLNTLIAIPSIAPSELQILVANSGVGDLTLSLSSINSVAYGGILSGGGPDVYFGTPPSFASGSTLSSANGNVVQTYLNDPTIFSAAFTLHGTITLDAPANSANYGDNLNSLVEFNLTSVPEPSTCLMFTIGFGMLVWRAIVRSRVKCSPK
jgi:hypothetical protein